MTDHWYLSRRSLLRAAGLAAVASAVGACASEEGGAPEVTGAAPSPTFADPSRKLSGSLKILLWSHFVPSHDKWFAPFAMEWGKRVGVNVTVDHINNAEVPARTAAEIQAGSGHDLIQYIATLSQFEEGVLDLKDVVDEATNRWGEQLDLCRKSSFNPNTNKFYAYSPGWVPDPGNFRKSLWSEAGLPDGPATWDDLLRGGTEIKSKKGVQLGLGMSQEIDSNMAGRALMWSFGASEQDANERVVLNSPETVAAVEFMTKLFKGSMTNEVFSWNAASNNQGMVAGKLAYILNSISAWRTAQEANPAVADDVHFTPALRGPKDAKAAQHVMYNWIVPKHAQNPDAAKEFLLHYTANFASVTWQSKLYDFPAWQKLVPDLKTWLGKDPYGAKPADKLAFLGDAIDWSTNIGHPGPANPAIGEVFGTFVIPNMFARAARGELSPQAAVQQADRQVRAIFDRWRARGLVGG
jgi:ABC-type glycerol-3-phosphate transport system substrate-binding protein